MKTFVTLVIFVFATALSCFSQSRLDSLINLRKTDFLGGKLPTWYTPGHEQAAADFQQVITDAITYYENRYSVQFQVKLIVLDSSQWLTEILPYGFVFFGRGWIVMNAGMDYATFKKVYKTEQYVNELDAALAREHVMPETMITAFLKFYSIHELGHYFLGKLTNAKSPDAWTGEFSASYFAYEFLLNNRPAELKPFELFCQADKDYYNPLFSSIADFNQKYTGTGVENYLWYHSNFYFLVKALYTCHRQNFVPMFERNFPKSATSTFTTEDIITILDVGCRGSVQKWVAELETRARKR
ncbi:MAG TPA: hypothetical protein PK325_14420 [Cyclobacteriaceae bacterium]|nr:hypothetical protein [Cyclobacteriaceae bacterium]HMV08465.1 hypothetical protein [Cyclobacteriaceae bacterium]HMV89176.1 hypothetical protein [Cyclobacteriaceae bacterium]HMX01238.1 hypothetical protein [Cyclobacteriaceae bacterium]HMX50641.1 hypothetical protein [Cyclobacteriaceae bacterium]